MRVTMNSLNTLQINREILARKISHMRYLQVALAPVGTDYLDIAIISMKRALKQVDTEIEEVAKHAIRTKLP